jgi:hypothetical protein
MAMTFIGDLFTPVGLQECPIYLLEGNLLAGRTLRLRYRPITPIPAAVRIDPLRSYAR